MCTYIQKTGYGRVYKSVLLSPSLSPGEKGVYSALSAYAGKSGIAFPHQERLALELSIGMDTLRKHLKSLEREKIITIIRTQKGNEYHLISQTGGWGVCPKQIMQNSSLPLAAKALYATLAAYAGTDGEAYPHRGTLLRGLSMGKDCFYKALNALIAQGYVEVESRRNGSRFTSSRFLLKNPLEKLDEKTTKKEKQVEEKATATFMPFSFTNRPIQGKPVSEKSIDAYNKEKSINTLFTINRVTTPARTELKNEPIQNGVSIFLEELPLLREPVLKNIAPLSNKQKLLCDVLERQLRDYQKHGGEPLSYTKVQEYALAFLDG